MRLLCRWRVFRRDFDLSMSIDFRMSKVELHSLQLAPLGDKKRELRNGVWCVGLFD